MRRNGESGDPPLARTEEKQQPLSLRSQAYKRISEWIAAGELKKGAVTSEGQLSRLLDMSRTPVRAALQQLELEGYVRIVSKHGILVLDSSSKRVSDLLEMVAALLLFAVNALRISNPDELRAYAKSADTEAAELMRKSDGLADGGGTLIRFEYGFLLGMVKLTCNVEMLKTFETAASRLHWLHNDRRWLPQHQIEAMDCLNRLIDALLLDKEDRNEALFAYIQVLKITWI